MRDAVRTGLSIFRRHCYHQNGKVIYEFPYTVYGLIPLMTMKESMNKTLEFDEKMRSIGTNLEKPFLTIQTISFTGLPFLRITDKGLVDIKNKQLMPLFV